MTGRDNSVFCHSVVFVRSLNGAICTSFRYDRFTNVCFFEDGMDGLLSIRLLMDFLLGEGSCSMCDFIVVSAISRNLCLVIWFFSSVFKIDSTDL